MIDSAEDYNLALVEASWFEAHPATTQEDRTYVNRLIKDLTEYEDQHGLESSELRELKAYEDSRND